MLKDPERTVTTMHRAAIIVAETDNYATKALVKAYADIVEILNGCVDEDSLACVWEKLESIEENLTRAIAGI